MLLPLTESPALFTSRRALSSTLAGMDFSRPMRNYGLAVGYLFIPWFTSWTIFRFFFPFSSKIGLMTDLGIWSYGKKGAFREDPGM